MTYLLIAWLYASGALLAFSLVGLNKDELTFKRGRAGQCFASLTWPVWVMVGIVVTVTGLARP